MRKLNYLLIALLTIFIASCAYNASLVKTAYDTLQVSQVSYDTSMKIVSDLYKRGELNEDEKEKVISYASTYSKAHNAAVEALASYEESRSMEDKEQLEKQLTSASEALTNLLQIIKPYIGD